MIVARGLGRGLGAVIVTAGLGLSGAPLPPSIDMSYSPTVTRHPGASLERLRIEQQNDMILAIVTAAVTNRMLE